MVVLDKPKVLSYMKVHAGIAHMTRAPFDLPEIEYQLKKKGYEIRIADEVVMGRKDGLLYVYDTNKGITAVMGTVLSKVQGGLNDAIDVSRSLLGDKFPVKLYELIIQARIQGTKSPEETLQNGLKKEFLSKFGKIFGDSLTYSIGIQSSDYISHLPVYSIRIEPLFENRKVYYVEYRFRTDDEKKARQHLNDIEKILLHVIEKIEEV